MNLAAVSSCYESKRRPRDRDNKGEITVFLKMRNESYTNRDYI